MAYKLLKLEDIKNKCNYFFNTKNINENSLDQNYIYLRQACVKEYEKIKKLANHSSKSKKHYLDMEFGFFLYDFLNSQPDFSAKYESNYDFWRYVAVCVIPDIVEYRWGISQTSHFYSKPTAIYPFQVYWYIKLSWQGTKEKTYDILKDNDTDQILQLVDRPSSIGVNVELYRRIMYKLSFVETNKNDVFRRVMLKNTAMLVNIRPEFYPGGINAYVDMLYQI